MRIDKMRSWVARQQPKTAERLQLGWDGPARFEVLADWTNDEITTMAEGGEDVCEAITQLAQEHADAQRSDVQRTTYQLRWIGPGDRVLRQVQHHVRPTPSEEEDPLGAAMAELPSIPGGDARSAQGLIDGALVKELARALLEKDRSMLEAYRATASANQQTIQMLMAQTEAYFKQLIEMRAAYFDLEAQRPEGMTDAELAVKQQQAAAWEKLAGFAPEVAQLAMHVLTEKALQSIGQTSGAEVAEPPNGHAGAV